jgi:hypothetical protein
MESTAVCVPPENRTPAAISASQAVHIVSKADEEKKIPELDSPDDLQDDPRAPCTPNIPIDRSAVEIDFVTEFLDFFDSSSAVATHEYRNARCKVSTVLYFGLH